MLKNPYLVWMFENCFPNTLDTTAHLRYVDGKPDTFVYTGDIHAMWLRNSGAQVWSMSILMRAFTSQDDEEIKECMRMLISTDAGTGLCMNHSTRTMPATLHANGLPGRTHCSANWR